MVDYVKLAGTADRLIEKNGREIGFVNVNDTPVDSDKPWLGPDESGDVITSLNAVMVPPNTVRQFGLSALGQGTEYRDLITFSEQILIVYPEDNDMRMFTHVLDNSIRWTIIGIQVLQPADKILLAFVGVRR